MSRHAPEARYKAAHDIDKHCCKLMQCIVDATESAFVIGAQDQLRSVRAAIEDFHKAATAAHDAAIREMK